MLFGYSDGYNYEYVTDYNAYAYSDGREGREVDKIVIHWWDDPSLEPQFMDVVTRFCSSYCATSAHFVVEEGRVCCLVNLDDTAYHCGDWYQNTVSIGIECNPRCSDGDLETVCQLVADIYEIYGELPIYGHKDFYNTACCGVYYDKLGYINQRALEILNERSGEESVESVESEDDSMAYVKIPVDEGAWLGVKFDNAKKKECSDWAKQDTDLAVKQKITDGTRPQDLATREEVWSMIVRAIRQ